MSDVVEGASVILKVVVVNKAGRILTAPVPADTVVAGSVTTDKVSAVNTTDGTFTFTAGAVDGDDSLVATGGGFTSPPFVETVVADNVPAGLQITST